MSALLNISLFTTHTHKSILVETVAKTIVPHLKEQLNGLRRIDLCHILHNEDIEALALALLLRFENIETAQQQKEDIVRYLSEVFHSQHKISPEELLLFPTLMEVLA